MIPQLHPPVSSSSCTHYSASTTAQHTSTGSCSSYAELCMGITGITEVIFFKAEKRGGIDSRRFLECGLQTLASYGHMRESD
jgi:hypothetical protein